MRTAITILIAVSAAGAAAVCDGMTMPRATISSGGASWAASDIHAMSCSTGLPCAGEAMGERVGLKGGFWSAVYVAEAPQGLVNPGWVWLSLPIQPQYPEVSAIFETDPVGRLYQWDWLHKNTLLYPNDFTTMESTVGYTLWSWTEEQPRYSGFLNRTPVDDPGAPDYRCTTVYIPSAGAITLGHPHPWPVPLADVKVMYGATVRTAVEDHLAGDPWTNWNWVYWDSGADVYGLCTFAGAMTTRSGRGSTTGSGSTSRPRRSTPTDRSCSSPNPRSTSAANPPRLGSHKGAPRGAPGSARHAPSPACARPVSR